MIPKDILRVQKLADLDLDYEALRNEFGPLSTLAAKVAGTELSEVNLIDNYTQWTVASSCNELSQMNREDSICNITIQEDTDFKSRVDLDPRFNQSSFVTKEGYKFYYGIPLKLNDTIAVGTLCVGSKHIEDLSEAQIQQLHIIAKQIVKQLELKYELQKAKQSTYDEKLIKLRLAHDIRSPLSGISQLVELIDYKNISKAEIKEIVDSISSAAAGILQLTSDILKDDNFGSTYADEATFTLESLGKKLTDLYTPQAKSKGISLSINAESNPLKFPKRNLLPLVGNLIANAIKFTQSQEQVEVALTITNSEQRNILSITVADSGIGMTQSQVNSILNTQSVHKNGTSGELGYGMGLLFVKELVANLEGIMSIESEKNIGTKIQIQIPIVE